MYMCTKYPYYELMFTHADEYKHMYGFIPDYVPSDKE